MRPLIVIGNPGDKRTDGIQQARDYLNMPPAIILSYAELLQGHSIDELLQDQGQQLSDQSYLSSDYTGSYISNARPLLRLESE